MYSMGLAAPPRQLRDVAAGLCTILQPQIVFGRPPFRALPRISYSSTFPRPIFRVLPARHYRRTRRDLSKCPPSDKHPASLHRVKP